MNMRNPRDYLPLGRAPDQVQCNSGMVIDDYCGIKIRNHIVGVLDWALWKALVLEESPQIGFVEGPAS